MSYILKEIELEVVSDPEDPSDNQLGENHRKDYFSITHEAPKCRQLMGYCPQFDGLQPNMTTRAHLHLYARTRGVPPSMLLQVVGAVS